MLGFAVSKCVWNMLGFAVSRLLIRNILSKFLHLLLGIVMLLRSCWA
jgi:hypothetical protein